MKAFCCAALCAVALLVAVLLQAEDSGPANVGPAVAPLARAGDTSSSTPSDYYYYHAPSAKPEVLRVSPDAQPRAIESSTPAAPAQRAPEATSKPSSSTSPNRVGLTSYDQPDPLALSAPSSYPLADNPMRRSDSPSTSAANDLTSSAEKPVAKNDSSTPGKTMDRPSRWRFVQAAFRQAIAPNDKSATASGPEIPLPTPPQTGSSFAPSPTVPALPPATSTAPSTTRAETASPPARVDSSAIPTPTIQQAINDQIPIVQASYAALCGSGPGGPPPRIGYVAPFDHDSCVCHWIHNDECDDPVVAPGQCGCGGAPGGCGCGGAPGGCGCGPGGCGTGGPCGSTCSACGPNGCGNWGPHGPNTCSCLCERLACCINRPYPDISNGCVDFCHSWIFHEDEHWCTSNYKCPPPWCGPYQYGHCPGAGPSGGGCGEQCGSCGPCYCIPSPEMYFFAEALVLTRDNQASRQNVFDEGGVPVIATSDFDFDWRAGTKFVFGYRPTRCDAWEVSYFGLQDWNSTQSVSGPADLSLPGAVGTLPGFTAADTVTANYNSKINNAELNYLWNKGCLTWIVGFRYFQLTENFDIDAVTLPTSATDYLTHTANNMYGGQWGLRTGGRYGRIGWDITGKVGAFGNNAEEEQRLIDSSRVNIRLARGSETNWAFVGDVGANAYWYFCKKWCASIGYNAIWVNGVALAPDQLDFTNTATSGTHLDHNGSIFYHGVNGGLGVRF